MSKVVALYFLALCLLGFSVAMFALWWKMFKKSVEKQKDTLAILDKN